MIGEQPRYTEVLGGAVGGLQRGDVPRVVGNLLEACWEREDESWAEALERFRGQHERDEQ